MSTTKVRNVQLNIHGIFVNSILAGYVLILGILTVITQISQALSLPFYLYAYAVAGILVAVSAAWLYYSWSAFRMINVLDVHALLMLLAASLLAVYLVTHLQPLNRFGEHNDDYYFLANAVFYTHFPGEPLNYVVHSLYSGAEPFVSATFLVTGPYQYIQSALAYVLHLNYVTFAYLICSPLSAIMFPFSLYLLLGRFIEKPAAAAFAVLITLLIVMLLGETKVSPGIWIFSRMFQGKSLVLSTGYCLFLYYSLNYLEAENWSSWAWLALLSIALLGMSTTTIMVLPVMALVIFAAYHFTYRNTSLFSLATIRLGLIYVSSLTYILLAAIYLSRIDSIQGAAYINREYTDSFWKYLSLFYNPAYPITPVVFLVFSIAAIMSLKEPTRKFVLFLTAFPLIILNPFVSKFLILLFRGIYFRMFYVLPLFFVVGLFVATWIGRLERDSVRMRLAIELSLCIGILVVAKVLPTSTTQAFDSLTDKMSGGNFEVAEQVIDHAPPGPVLAPYPISSTIYVLNPAYPQLLMRSENTNYALWTQNRLKEWQWRSHSQELLFGNIGAEGENYDFLGKLVRRYPEIKTMVFSEILLSQVSGFEQFLQMEDYVNKLHSHGFVIAWK